MTASFWLLLFKEYEKVYRQEDTLLRYVDVEFELDGKPYEVTHRLELENKVVFQLKGLVK